MQPDSDDVSEAFSLRLPEPSLQTQSWEVPYASSHTRQESESTQASTCYFLHLCQGEALSALRCRRKRKMHLLPLTDFSFRTRPMQAGNKLSSSSLRPLGKDEDQHITQSTKSWHLSTKCECTGNATNQMKMRLK